MNNSKNQSITKKLMSFGLKTSVGYIPIFGPVLSASISELETIKGELKSDEITRQIIDKLKKDKKNIDLIWDGGFDLQDLISYLPSEPLPTFLKKVVAEENNLNLAQKAFVIGIRLKIECNQAAAPKFDKDQLLDVQFYLYDFLCEVEANIWMTNNVHSHLYSGIAWYSNYVLRQHELSIYYSIKAMDANDDHAYKIGVFFEIYLPTWKAMWIAKIQKESTFTSSGSSVAQCEIFVNSLLETSREIRENCIASSTVYEKDKNQILWEENHYTLANSPHMQLVALFSLLFEFCNQLKVSEERPFISVVLENAEYFYDSLDVIEEDTVFLWPDKVKAIKAICDELFQLDG